MSLSTLPDLSYSRGTLCQFVRCSVPPYNDRRSLLSALGTERWFCALQWKSNVVDHHHRSICCCLLLLWPPLSYLLSIINNPFLLQHLTVVMNLRGHVEWSHVSKLTISKQGHLSGRWFLWPTLQKTRFKKKLRRPFSPSDTRNSGFGCNLASTMNVIVFDKAVTNAK
jgi:hypothetical protein